MNEVPATRVNEVPAAQLQAFAVPDLPEVGAGDDLAELVLAALAAAGLALMHGDVLVVASKVVSKAQGRTVEATGREQAVDGQSVRVVAQRMTPRGLARIVQSRSGPVMAAAGVDASNVPPGTVLLLPEDPDAAARDLRARLAALTGLQLGVVVSDTAGRAWRQGQTDFALGAAGVRVVDDLRGGRDDRGQALEVTVRALADEIAALGDLVKGKVAGLPVAVVRGLHELVTDEDGPGAASLLRPAADDWFRLGHVEAVRAALGAGDVPPPSVAPTTRSERVHRAVRVALAGDPDPGRWEVDVGDDEVTMAASSGAASLLDLGQLVQRLRSALWCEDLTGDILAEPPAGVTSKGAVAPLVRLRVSPPQCDQAT